jgi:ribosomal protein S5
VGAERILTVVIGSSCSLCDAALDRLRLPADLLRVRIVTEHLDESDQGERFSTRVPVVLGPEGGVVAEGRITASAAWKAVVKARFGRRDTTDSGPSEQV